MHLHIAQCHKNIDSFSRIRDYVDSERTSPIASYTLIQDPHSGTVASALSSDNNTQSDNFTLLDLSEFLDDLWPEKIDGPSISSDSAPSKCTLSTITMDTKTLINISTQTDINHLPPKNSTTYC